MNDNLYYPSVVNIKMISEGQLKKQKERKGKRKKKKKSDDDHHAIRRQRDVGSLHNIIIIRSPRHSRKWPTITRQLHHEYLTGDISKLID